MKKFICLFMLVGFIISNVALAQDKKQLTAEGANYMNPDMFPKRLSQISWRGGSDKYAYIKDKNIVSARYNSKDAKPILSLEKLSKAIVDAGGKELKRFPYIIWIDKDIFIAIQRSKYFLYDLKENEAKFINETPMGAQNVKIDKKNFVIAYTKDNNLFVSIKGKEVAVTNNEDKNLISGQSVSRNEFGIDGGIFWSPEGNSVAYYTKDVSKVSDYPIVDVTARVAEHNPIKYPMAGMDSEHVTLSVYNVETEKTVTLKTEGPYDQYLTSVTWSPDEKNIYVALLNREQNHAKLNKYDANTGELVKTLFEEKDEKYVEPQFPLYFPHGDSRKFIWMSQRDGYNHMYLYTSEGKLIRQLTKGEWIVTGFLGFDNNNRKAFFTSTEVSPLDRTAYSVTMSGKKTRITPQDGTHSMILNSTGKYAIDIYSDTTVARVYQIVNAKGKVTSTLLKDVDPVEDYAFGKTTVGTVKNNEGTDLYYRLITPADFDPNKKYPAIVYVYGGPHAQMITNSWLAGAGFWLNYMANQGYVVFTVDSRGSFGRGLAFEQAIHRNLGTVEVEDQVAGVNYLKTLPYVDADKIGVDGWSYGGFMTIAMMTDHPEIFKVGVAGGPVVDWKYYEIMYGERYMDTPEENPEGYKNANLMNKIKNLQGRLLVMHGAIDPTVVWQHSLQLLNQAIADDKILDYYVYPKHEHNVRGKDRANMFKKIMDYFNTHLK
ncbi:MAG: DPP IV N-terminal domain-containing protein [Hyphomicrobiales bacterium]